MKKKAYNPVKTKGFDSKAQARYLLHLLQEHPEKYSWVKEVIKEHGLPSEEGPLHTYWEGPYNVSPETPSYKYTGRKSKKEADLISRLTRLATKLKERNISAEKIDNAIKILSRNDPKELANSFWSLWGNSIRRERHNQEALGRWMSKFHDFLSKYELSSKDRIEAEHYFGDKILDRVVE